MYDKKTITIQVHNYIVYTHSEIYVPSIGYNNLHFRAINTVFLCDITFRKYDKIILSVCTFTYP